MPPRFAEILVDGPDALSFVHGQLASDVKAIAPGHWRHAAYCVPDGRVQALMMVAVETATRLRLLLPEDLAASVQHRLGRYRLRARCEFSVRPVRITTPAPEAPASAAADDRIYQCEAFEWLVTGADSEPLPAELWSEQVTHGVPWIVAATSEKFLPQMLALEQLAAFSLRKGCFPGQEVVARTHFLGRSKRHLVSLTRSGGADPLEPGNELLSSLNVTEICGWIIADALPQRPIALAVVTESAPDSLTAAEVDAATFVINRESTETKRDKLLNGRCLAAFRT